MVHLSIDSLFVGVHGPYELHRKEKQMIVHRVSVSEQKIDIFMFES